MKRYLILLPLFLLALLQGTVWDWNLVLAAVLVWTAIRPAREGMMVAFWSGLFLDLAVGTPLGFSSLILLLASGLLLLYSRRFDPTHPAFLAVFVFLASVGFNLLSQKPWLKESLVLAGLVFLIGPLMKFYQAEKRSEKLKLSL